MPSNQENLFEAPSIYGPQMIEVLPGHQNLQTTFFIYSILCISGTVILMQKPDIKLGPFWKY